MKSFIWILRWRGEQSGSCVWSVVMPPGPAAYHVLLQRAYSGILLMGGFFEKTVLTAMAKNYILLHLNIVNNRDNSISLVFVKVSSPSCWLGLESPSRQGSFACLWRQCQREKTLPECGQHQTLSSRPRWNEKRNRKRPAE